MPQHRRHTYWQATALWTDALENNQRTLHWMGTIVPSRTWGQRLLRAPFNPAYTIRRSLLSSCSSGRGAFAPQFCRWSNLPVSHRSRATLHQVAGVLQIMITNKWKVRVYASRYASTVKSVGSRKFLGTGPSFRISLVSSNAAAYRTWGAAPRSQSCPSIFAATATAPIPMGKWQEERARANRSVNGNRTLQVRNWEVSTSVITYSIHVS